MTCESWIVRGDLGHGGAHAALHVDPRAIDSGTGATRAISETERARELGLELLELPIDSLS